MVDVTIEEDSVKFEVKGLHKLWALKGSVSIPVRNIRDVRHDPTEIEGFWKGWKFPGTHLPGIIVAGTYCRQGKKCFWDASRREKTIVVDIEGGPYDKVIVDVEDPEEVMTTLLSANG